MDKTDVQKTSVMPVLVDLVAMYLITGILLVVLAMLLGRVDMSDAAVSIGIIVTYIVSCIAGGFFIGKKKEKEEISVGAVCRSILFCGIVPWKSGCKPRPGRTADTYDDNGCIMYIVGYGRRDDQLMLY